MRSIQVWVLAGLCVVLLLPGEIRGETFDVTTDEDKVPAPVGSLREAIDKSREPVADADLITFSIGPNKTITLETVFSAINGDLDIDGATAPGLTIDGTGGDDLKIDSGTTTIRQIDLVDFGLNITGASQKVILDSGMGDMEMSFAGSAEDVNDSVLKGGGELIKQGSGTLELFVDGSGFTGKMSIEAGTVRSDVMSINGATSIANEGELVIVEDGAIDDPVRIFGSAISGAGSLVKEGGATIGLAGKNDFSGGITIRGGGIEGSTDTLGTGGITFDPDDGEIAGLGIGQNEDGTLPGGVTGNGFVGKDGSGIVTLGGSNDYSGFTAIIGGGLVIQDANLSGNIILTAGTSIAFDQSNDGTLSGGIEGPGTFTKQGAGSLTLSSGFDSSGFSGTSTVSAGALILENVIFETSALSVASGGILAGTGTVTGATTISGTVDPAGDDFGVLTVENTVDFSGSGTLVAQIREAGDPDQLVVNGLVTLTDNPNLQITIGDGAYETPVDRVVLMSTTNPIDGEFAPIEDDLAFLDVTIVDTAPADTVTVSVVANDNGFQDFAETPNQTAVAVVLDDVRFDAEGDMQTVMDALTTLTVGEVPDALDALAGEQLTAFFTPRLAAHQRLAGAMDSRMRGFAAGSPATLPAEMLRPRISMSASGGPMASLVMLAGNAPAMSTAPKSGDSGFGGWLDGYGVLGSIDGGNNPKDVDYDVFGASGGVDYRFGDRFLVGGAFGYAYTDIDIDDLSGSQEIDTYQGALYGSWAGEQLHVGTSVGFGYSDMESKRKIVFGDLDRKAKADFDGWSAIVHAEAGYDVFALWGIKIQPLGTFDYLHLEQESFTESGAGAADLKMQSEDIDSIVSGVGVRLHSNVRSGRGNQFTPNIHARWLHEFGDTKRRANLTMTGAGDAGAFSVKGADIGRDALSAGVGYTVSLRGGLHLYAGYDVIWNPDVLEHGFGGGIQFAW